MKYGLIAALSTLIAACGAAPTPAAQAAASPAAEPAWVQTTAADDPLLRPIAPASGARWLGAQQPFRVHGNTYLVGFSGLNVALIDTGDGLILVDAGVPQGVRQVEANIAALGFRLGDVKYILSTEPHYDHGGGLAALSRDTGATVLAGAAAVDALSRGGHDADDPQAEMLPAYPPVTRLRGMADGERVTLGGVTVTAVSTPGHTHGSTSWTWRSCEGDDCQDVIFVASLSPVSEDGYRFSDPAHAAIPAAFRRAYARLRGLDCGIVISGHPDQNGEVEKRAKLRAGARPNPYASADACTAWAASQEARLERRLAEEAQSR